MKLIEVARACRPRPDKWAHFFEVYERHLERFRGRPITLVEVGVQRGGSLLMWHQWLGEQARIVGVDIDSRCNKKWDVPIEIVIGDQTDPTFWEGFRKEYPEIHVLIDDGAHTLLSQEQTFLGMYKHLDPHGVYVCEDIVTSYWPKFGGSFVDQMHAWHASALSVDDVTKSTHSVHYYLNMVVIEKRPMGPLKRF